MGRKMCKKLGEVYQNIALVNFCNLKNFKYPVAYTFDLIFALCVMHIVVFCYVKLKNDEKWIIWKINRRMVCCISVTKSHVKFR